jgi:hypothetical protein
MHKGMQQGAAPCGCCPFCIVTALLIGPCSQMLKVLNSTRPRLVSRGEEEGNDEIGEMMMRGEDPSPNSILTDADLYYIVVCQVEWFILCEKGRCHTKKGVEPMGRCKFNNAVWNAGPTCITNYLHGDKHPQCPDTMAQSTPGIIKALCRNATHAKGNMTTGELEHLSDSTELGACKKLADGLAEYY